MIKYSEFLAMVYDTKQLVEEENLWIAFKQFDTDNDDRITLTDFRGALEKVGCFLNDEEFKEVVKEF